MKKTIFKIMSLALTIGLLASLIVGAVPAGALTVVDASASSTIISDQNVSYTIKFTGALNLEVGDWITVAFPLDFGLDNLNQWDAGFDNGDDTDLIVGMDDVNDIDFSAMNAGILRFQIAEAATIGNVWTLVIGDWDDPLDVDNGITNPDAAGSYVLSISTSQEPTPVQTPSITIGSPGIIQYYNAAGAYLGTAATFPELFEEVGVIGEGWTLKVGAGVYLTFYFAGPTPTDVFYIENDDITLTSSAGPTIIVGNMFINGDDFTMSDVIKGGDSISVNGWDATFENVIFNKTVNKTGPPSDIDYMVYVFGDRADFSGCTFNLNSPAGYQDFGLLIDHTDGVTVDDCTFNLDQTVAYWGDFGIISSYNDNLEITNCNFNGTSGYGIYDRNSGDCCDVNFSTEIAFNTFTGVETPIEIYGGSAEIFKNTITGSTVNNDDYWGAVSIIDPDLVNVYANNFTDNEGFAIAADGYCNETFIAGNNFIDNEQDISGLYVADVLECVANYWGSATGPGPGAVIGDNVVYEPFLTVPTDDAFAFGAFERDLGASFVVASPSDAQYAGYSVRNYGYADALGPFGWVCGQTLSGNPADVEPPFPAIAYFDVYTSEPTDTLMQVNLYADGLTEASNVYYWSGNMEGWVLCSDQGVAGSGAFAWLKIGPPGVPNILGNQTVPAPDELQGTYFVIVDGIAPPTENIVPSGPEAGAATGLCNIPFSWPTVPGATSYQIVIWTTDMSTPIVEESVSSPSFMSGCLDAGSYFWKVFAMQGDNVLSESAVNSFVAEAPPSTETTPPITITSQPPASITITQPPQTTVTIELPPEQPITPAWIYVIIGIGAVLVIVVIVLIVRTRRTT